MPANFPKLRLFQKKEQHVDAEKTAPNVIYIWFHSQHDDDNDASI